MDLDEIQVKTELTANLTSENIKYLIQFLQPPAGMFEDVTEGFEFLFTLKHWEGHNSYLFDLGLNSIGRADLVPLARKLPWLSTEHPVIKDQFLRKDISLKSLVNLLKFDIQKHEWLIMDIDAKLIFEAKMATLIRANILTANLDKLIALMRNLNREDLAGRIAQHKFLFTNMSDNQFIKKLRKEVKAQTKDLLSWENSLREFITVQNIKVKQVLDDEDLVDLESVYVPLTIIEDKPMISVEDETTYNEIAFLRKIANKEVEIEPVNFTEEMKNYDPSQAKIWCLIGNPGSGKTFLCHMTALKFGKGQLSKFIYSISIPCRTPDWHDMETSRIDSKLPITSEFIQQWLCLGMPVGPSWTSDLAQHLVESDGQDLLLILDSMDEFVREVPFQKTLLFLLLTRRTLTHCTILLTSRPGAYTDISTAHSLHIDRFFHVLGFSPENRDLYFQKQLENEGEDKMNEWKRLLYLHDEIDQLSLVPVNASLFASLVRDLDKVSAQTLTQLYTQLSVYLIRRQLYRMGLQMMGKKSPTLSLMHPDVVVCLRNIGEIAYQGLYFRKLTSSASVTLRVDKKLRECQCLGLVLEYLQKDSMGVVTKVWSFAHLTMQEFIGAFWLSECSWGDQCASIRYIVNSSDNFNLFRMMVRFLCGLLCDSGLRVLYILYKYYPNTPVAMTNMPMYYQLNYSSPIHSIMGWTEFTEKYLSLSALLFESNSDSNNDTFPCFRTFLPQSLFFYFDSATPPNEWECFLKSLHLLHYLELICFDSRYVTIPQFRALLSQLTSCTFHFLAVKLELQDYSTLTTYSEVIRECQLPSDTKISLELSWCDLTDTESADNVSFTSVFKIFSSLCLILTQFTHQYMQQLANQLKSTDYLYIYPHYSKITSEYETLLPHLSNTTQLTGLYFYLIPPEYMQLLETVLPRLSNLQEITLHTDTAPYSLLPRISCLSNLKYLQLSTVVEPTDSRHQEHLMQLLDMSTHTLRGLKLGYLHRIGNSCGEVFLSLLSCTGLVEIQLTYTNLLQDDIILLGTTVSQLRFLLHLFLESVSLSDSGMLYLCRGLLFHPNIRSLCVPLCNLNSDSCVYITNLIPTLKQFNRLDMYGNNLSKPNPVPVTILKQTADLYFVIYLGLE